MKDCMKNLMKGLHADALDEWDFFNAEEEDTADCHLSEGVKRFDEVSIMPLVKATDATRYILGNRYNKLSENKISIVSYIEHGEHCDAFIPLKGRSIYYELHVKGVEVGHFQTILVPSVDEMCYMDDEFSEELGRSMFMLVDTLFDPYPLYTRKAFSRLEEMGSYSDIDMAYWHELHIIKEHRGKGYAEILMRAALHASPEGCSVQLVSCWEEDKLPLEAEDGERKIMKEHYDKKQSQLNTFYKKFFIANNMSFSLIEEGSRFAFVAGRCSVPAREYISNNETEDPRLAIGAHPEML